MRQPPRSTRTYTRSPSTTLFRSTADYLAGEGIAVERANKVAEGRPHIVDRIKDGDVQLIFNTTEGWQSLQDSQSIRASALAGHIASYPTAAGSAAWNHAPRAFRRRRLSLNPPPDDS